MTLIKKPYRLIVLITIIINILFNSGSELLARVDLGLDIVIANKFELLEGKKIGLLTNHSCRSKSNLTSVEEILKSDKCELLCIFTPEHGFYTTIPAGESIKDDSLFGLPVFSLYGDNRKPRYDQLKSLDALVIDLQDIGVRSYTYISTVYLAISACAEYDIDVVILDRPNPIGGNIVDGNIVDPGYDSFVSQLPIPYIHGCTIGELAIMMNEEGWLKTNAGDNGIRANITVVEMKGWTRDMTWEETELPWYPTSPHIPNVDAIRGIAMLGVFGELGIINIGVGTTLPFQYLGSPYLIPEKLLNTIDFEIHGVTLIPSKFRPFYGLYNGKDCMGFLIKFYKDSKFQPYSIGFRIFLALRKIHPELFNLSSINSNSRQMFSKVVGNGYIFDLLTNNGDDKTVLSEIQKGLDEFIQKRKEYLIY